MVSREKLIRLGWQTFMAAAILLAWQLLPSALGLSPLILPPFSDVLAAATEPLAGGASLTDNLLVTLREIALAFLIAAAAGLSVGILIGSSRVAAALIQPLLTALFAVPLITLIPLFLVTFGLGAASKIAFGALYAFFPIIFNTVAGVSSVEAVHRSLGEAFGLSWWAKLVKVTLPSAARQILGGLQMGMAIVIIAVVSAEVFGSTAGMGYLLQRSAQNLDGSAVWYLVLVTFAMAWVLLTVVRLAARLLRVRPEAPAW
jgi:ABC-type nitrate/sulfonate/bicarbonate transport system permease component